MKLRGHDPLQAATRLRATEAERTISHGYGSRNFASSLIQTAAELESRTDPTLKQCFENEGEWIFHHPIEVFPDVERTLDALASRHEIHLVTKGDQIEQSGKIERSGLKPYFRTIHILREKDVASYRRLLAQLTAGSERTWMVGNSPRSDINPARLAGLQTVFIPHRTIWELEDERFDGHPDLSLRRFADLDQHF
jgi:putative hydrolase of the HAD superfamily